MKSLSSLLLLSALSLTAEASILPHNLPQLPLLRQGSLPVMPPPSDSDPSHQPAVPLTDILGTLRSLTTFSSLARLHESTVTLLSDMQTNTTVLAPLNSAIEDLPRKPWEEPGPVAADAYEGDEGRERAQKNLRRFVEAHLVTASPWEGKDKAKTVGGREIWWEWRDGDKRVVMPDGIEVEKVAKQVANGEVWILKGVLNYF